MAQIHAHRTDAPQSSSKLVMLPTSCTQNPARFTMLWWQYQEIITLILTGWAFYFLRKKS